MSRRKRSPRGATRDPAEMAQLVAACTEAITKDAGGQRLTSAEMRTELVICLRDQYECTLEQIGEVVDLSAERVRQLYQGARQAHERRAREARAPVEELSPRALQGLTDVGLEPGASMHVVTRLLPMLRLAARAPHDPSFNANFQAHQLDRATVREIEDWLRRHGVVVR